MQPDAKSLETALVHCAIQVQHKNPKDRPLDSHTVKHDGRRAGSLEINPRQWQQVEKDGRA